MLSPSCHLAVMVCLAAALLTGRPALADPVRDAISQAEQQSFLSSARIAQLARSERLRMFFWGKWIETGQAPRAIIEAMRGGLVRQGFYHDADRPALILTDSQLGVSLGYDSNINGGTTQESFSFGGLSFDADPDLLATPGVVLGLGSSGIGRLALSGGSYLELAANGAAGWAPASGLGLFDASLQLCARDHLVRWTFLDACLLEAWSVRDLSDARLTLGSLALSTIFEADHGWHELSGQIAHTDFDDYAQITTSLGMGSVWGRAMTEASLTLGVPVEGTTALAQRLALDVHWLIAQQPVSLSLWHATARGGRFLGVDREDQSFGIGYKWQAGPGPIVEIDLVRRSSTIEIYDQLDASFRLSFDGFGL